MMKSSPFPHKKSILENKLSQYSNVFRDFVSASPMISSSSLDIDDGKITPHKTSCPKTSPFPVSSSPINTLLPVLSKFDSENSDSFFP